MSWSSVALYTLTGTFTSPKEIEPFQMERMDPVCPHRDPDKRLRVTCGGFQGGPIRQVSTRSADGKRSRTAGRIKRRRQRIQVYPGKLAASLGAQQTASPQRVDQADHE